MTSPSTEAGRALLDEQGILPLFIGAAREDHDYLDFAVLAIEAEARDQALAEIEEAVRRTFSEKVQHYDLMVEPDDSAYMELDAGGRYVIADEAEETVLAAIETARRNPR